MHFSIIICLFAHRFIYYSILLRVKDKTGIDILFKEYYPQLYYYAYHLINDIEASKDIVSDAFEFLWNNYGKVNKVRGSRNLVGIIVSYSHPKFRPLPHGNKSIGGVGSHRASL